MKRYAIMYEYRDAYVRECEDGDMYDVDDVEDLLKKCLDVFEYICADNGYPHLEFCPLCYSSDEHREDCMLKEIIAEVSNELRLPRE